jgi:hypothetical protein
VRFKAWPDNRGLGATLNVGLDLTTAAVVAYLPADDLWDRDHLRGLSDLLARRPDVELAYAGVRHHGGAATEGAPPGHPLQLVQVAHRRTSARWRERGTLESDDLDLLMWERLGPRAGTGRVTCTWVDHPRQRHKAIRESYDGGLNVFRRRYRVQQPLRFHSRDSGTTDEVARYAAHRARRYPDPPPDALDVLIVGELAFNPERVLALRERGHRLHGLWTEDGLGDASVGPLPFGHVRDLPTQGWVAAVRDLRPDVVWAQLNWRAVPLAVAVRRAFPDLPFVWHFKESPQRSIARGEWPALAELFLTADACVLATEEERRWVLEALPGRLDPGRLHVLDGDLPPAEWSAAGPPAARLSERDGQPHTVVLGRPLGFDAPFVTGLVDAGVHLHLYGQVDAPGPKGAWRDWWHAARSAHPDLLHLHPPVGPQRWVGELSAYDAGWLHRTTSTNGGDLRRATWDDLNSPARLPVLMAAGLPVLLPDTSGHAVAVQRITREDGTGLEYADADGAAALLRDAGRLAAVRAAAGRARHRHTFDHHVDRLLALFTSLRR